MLDHPTIPPSTGSSCIVTGITPAMRATARSRHRMWDRSVFVGPRACTAPLLSFSGRRHHPLGMMAYVGTTDGDVLAFKVGTGQLVWGRSLGGDILASPVVSDGALWVGTQDPAKLYKFNLTTGATQCSLVTSKQFFSSFTAATPPGGKPSIYVSHLDNGITLVRLWASLRTTALSNGAFLRIPQLPARGRRSPMVSTKGHPAGPGRVVRTDDSEYAINALTGKEVWRFQAPATGDYDMAAGATISAPGTNGFADGVAYVPSKYGTIYALDLTTGAKLWSHVFNRPPVGTATETGAIDRRARRDQSGVRAPRGSDRSQRGDRSDALDVQRPDRHRSAFLGRRGRAQQQRGRILRRPRRLLPCPVPRQWGGPLQLPDRWLHRVVSGGER